ncbi:MAG: phosphotransferase [Aggregatilineales bacterium]
MVDNALHPAYSVETIRDFLATLYKTMPENLAQQTEDALTQVFTFQVNATSYVMRISANGMGQRFRLQTYLQTRYGSPSLPILVVSHYGTIHDHHYGIMEKPAGEILDTFKNLDISTAIDNLIQAHDAIRTADVSDTSGYGWLLDETWNGYHASWHEHLRYVASEEPETMFYHQWHHLFEDTFLERDVFDALYTRMESLLCHCPEDRYLSHAMFGLSNAIGQENGTINAVINWTDAGYRDFVFDVAYADYWWDNDIASRFIAHWSAIGLDVPDARERLLCYQLYTGLDGMRFFAKVNQEDGYRYNHTRIERAIAAYEHHSANPA